MGMKDQEYQTLYSEIGRNSQISQNVFVANVAVTAVLIGYGLQAESGPIFMAPFAIIVPSMFFLASQLESTTRIAAYLLVFHEADDPALNWESRWLILRRTGLIPTKRKYTLSLSGLYGLLSFVCLLLALQYWPYSLYWYMAAALGIAVVVAWAILLLLRAFSLEMVDAYIDAWERIRAEEDEKDETVSG